MYRWRRCTIGSLIDEGVIVIHKDGNHGANYPRVEDFGTEGLPFLTAKSLSDWKIDFRNAPRLSETKARTFKFGHVEAGDVLLSHNATVGRVAVVPAIDEVAVIGTSLTQFRVDPSKLLPRFLAIYFSSRDFQNQLSFVMAQTTRNQVPITEQRRLPIHLPPMSSQKAIADIVFSLIDKIDLNRRMNETLEAMARAIFKDWFVDFGPTRAKMEGRTPYLAPEIWALFPDRLDDEGWPENWKSESVLAQANWINGAAYKNMHFVESTLGLPVVKIAELKSGVTSQTKFTCTDLGGRYRIKDGEVLFSWSGNPDTSIDTFIWTGGPAWLNQHIFAVRENGRRKQTFVYTLLKWLNPVFAELARNKQTTGLGHVTKEDLERLQVVVPSPALELEFDRIVGPILDRLRAALFENRALASTRGALLPKLISGEIRVKEAERAMESVS